jgi:hypothetical protein
MILLLRREGIALLLAAITFTTPAVAQDVGVAYFAMMAPSFPCEEALEVFDPELPSATAVLWGTFGTDTRCIEKWFARGSGKPHLLEIHPTNEACRRNKRCEPLEIASRLDVRTYNKRLASRDPEILSALRKRVSEITDFAKAHSGDGVEFILSTGLEDNFTAEGYRVVLELFRELWPYKITRSPVGTLHDSPVFSADFLELHTGAPSFPPGQPCIANLDGTDIDFPHRPAPTSNNVSWDAAKAFAHRFSTECRVAFLWSGPWQGVTTSKFTPPSMRSHLVDTQDISLIRELRKSIYSSR